MPRPRNTASRTEQEDAILKAAAEEVALVGVSRTSLAVIARSAGVSRSTLYRRFPNRNTLITELGRRTFDFAMARLRTVAIDSGPKDAAVAAFCEGLRLLTTEPVMRQFLQLDADLSTVAGMCQQAKAFLDSASAAMAKALRAAGAAMPDAELSAVSELHIRLACSLAQVPSRRLDTRDDAAVREYARKHLAPLVW
ncbi:TetR/AcrR family transcriptional regulator [Mycobacterium shimoidei]|uniref:TetR/AcrR family transcriptional regulator n=1 Tax=Mycobacterium shimoidei TaxID=29313 RepID=UPI000848A001|nr:helix-turn-helix domain-containing protein [Mycobacterium shimoidei]MCV7259707.1 helix-turn-helix transcriptional regulator [Mycobacterium shimoidei]ODR09617.1 TetR family transcriptional regulator [Mycobacterium shimoidei]ORW81997.1 TetR family transcriptional regulator [Mycobacterium shimoidei]